MSLIVHLMGTVRLVRNGQPVDVGGPKQQAVLAVLALSAGRRVSTDRLVDLVWDENPPASARRTVQSNIASLRRALGDGAALEPSQNGYALNVDRGQVDLLAFEDQAADLLGDVGLDPDDKAQGLADMLSNWATPLDGLRDAPRLGELTAPFEELHLQALEGLAAAQIAGTHAGDAVRMLETLVREHPTRENLWLRLAEGLAVLGRRDTALEAIQRAREALREHLGVDPSARLSDFEIDLLTRVRSGGRVQGEHLDQRFDHQSRQLVEDPTSDIVSKTESRQLPATSATRRSNIPERVAPVLRRERELESLVSRIANSRLVTIHGAAGVGKTQTALELCRRVDEEFDGGQWVIELAQFKSDDELDDTVSTVLDLAMPSIVTSPQSPALLVLDNCEHVLSAARRAVQHLLESSPETTIVCTSRQPLSVVGESTFHLNPLATTPPFQGEGVSDASAVLFELASEATGTDFDEEQRKVLEACAQRLGGLPLSIQLAAPCLRTMSPAELYGELDHQVDLLSRGSVGSTDRHVSLRAAIEWSFSLLEPVDRQVFAELAVFAGSFGRDEIDAIVQNIEGGAVQAVRRLAERSLVQVSTQGAHTSFALLEAMKEFATSELATTGAETDVRVRHAEHFLTAAESLLSRWGRLVGAGHIEPLLPELQAAAHWLRGTAERGQSERALLVLADAAGRCSRHHLETGASLQALEIAEDALRDEPQNLELLELAAHSAWRVGKLDAAAEHAQAWIAEGSHLERVNEHAAGLRLLARVRLEQHRDDEVEAVVEDLELLLEILPPPQQAQSLVLIAQIRMLQEQDVHALHAADRAIAITKLIGDGATLAGALVEKGSTLVRTDQKAEGIRLLYKAAELASEHGDEIVVARATYNLANRVGNLDERRRLLARSIAAGKRAGWAGLANARTKYMELAIDEGNLAEARRFAAADVGSAGKFDVVSTSLFAAHLALEAGDVESALHVVAELDRRHPDLNGRPELFDRRLVDARLEALDVDRRPINAELEMLSTFPERHFPGLLTLSLDDLHEAQVDHLSLAQVYADIEAPAGAQYADQLYVGGWVHESSDPTLARQLYKLALKRTSGEHARDRIDPVFSSAVHLGLARLDEADNRNVAALDHLDIVVDLLGDWPGPRRQRARAARDRITEATAAATE